MNQLEVLAIILIFIKNVEAQDKSDSKQGLPFHPKPAVITAILSVLFLIIFIIVLIYVKYIHVSALEQPLDQNPSNHASSRLTRLRSGLLGLGKLELDSLPYFRFSSLNGSKEGLECAICLSKFENEEKIRVLPKCKRTFHLICIDLWLKSNSTCPLCRDKFDFSDLKSLVRSLSSRFLSRAPSSLRPEIDLDILIHSGHEENHPSSSFDPNEDGDFSIEMSENGSGNYDMMQRSNNKIISDVIMKNRWSDADSSDLPELFGFLEMSDRRIGNDMLDKDEVEAKKVSRSYSDSTLVLSSHMFIEENLSELIGNISRRFMADITTFDMINNNGESSSPNQNNHQQDRIRRLWMQLVLHTIQQSVVTKRNAEKLMTISCNLS